MLAKQNPSDMALTNGAPDRRRRERLDLDLTDPAEHEGMRVQSPQIDRILVIDKQSTFRDDLAPAMAHHVAPVEWVGSADAAG